MSLLAGMASLGQPQSVSMLDSTFVANSAPIAVPITYAMPSVPFSTVAQSPSNNRYPIAPLHYSLTTAFTGQTTNTTSPLQQLL